MLSWPETLDSDGTSEALQAMNMIARISGSPNWLDNDRSILLNASSPSYTDGDITGWALDIRPLGTFRFLVFSAIVKGGDKRCHWRKEL